MELELLVPILAAAVQSATPLLYATLGEMFMERAGVLNLGIEGIMLFGAFTAFLGLYLSGSPWLGFLCGGLGGLALASVHGLICLVLRGNQVVSGLALATFGCGLANYLGTPFIGKTTEGFSAFNIPVLSELPAIGQIFFQQDALVYLAFLLPPLFWFILVHTSFGLAIRATGENPEAARSSGISPLKVRWQTTLLGGFLAGLGGAYLSLAYMHIWTDNITAGRGWIAVALVIFAFWRPARALFGALLFGGVVAFQLRLQATGTAIPSSFLHMLPYLLTLFVLFAAGYLGRGRNAPKSLGVNIEPEA